MPRRYYLLVTAATLAGAFLRLWQLTEVPPGLHYDLAATALLGEQVAFDGFRPVFITAYTGHEVLFYYWLAAWFNLVGSSVFTLRLAAALLGVLTIPATFFAVRQALHGEEHAFQVAAFAAVLLAFAFFHLVFSRFGFRVIVMPPVLALAIGFLFRGLRRFPGPGVWDLSLAGAFTGLAAYTYLSARLFPFPLAVFWLAVFILTWRAGRSHPLSIQASFRPLSLGFGVFSVSALLAFAPLGLYFLQHPEDFLNRATQVVVRPGESDLFWLGFRRAAEMLFINGEPYDRFNLPGLPLFGFPLGVFFVLGLLITLRRAFTPDPPLPRPPAPLRRAAEWLLLAWLPFMLLPTALSVHDVFPSNVRAFGLIPLVFVFPARGLVTAYRWLQPRSPGPLLPSAYPLTILGLVVLVTGTGAAYRDYFVQWAGLRSQRLNNDADLTGIAHYLNRHPLEGATPYVSAIHYRHPTLAYLARDFGQIRWLTGGASLAVPADGAALYLLAASAPLPAEWIAGWAPYRLEARLGPDNRPEFEAYRFEAGQTPPLPDFTPLDENFGNALSLTGYRLTPDAETLAVDLRWRVENRVAFEDLLPYARLYDAAGRAWAQSGNFTYPSAQWAPGDTLLTRQLIPLPAGLPAGDYEVKAGLYSEAAQTGLPRLNARGGFGGERAVLGTIRLAGGPAATLDEFRAAHPVTSPDTRQGLQDDLVLLGYQWRGGALRPNERFELSLFWYAAAPVTTPVRVSLGAQVLFEGTLNVQGALIDRRTLRVPPDAALGAAPLRVSADGHGEAQLAQIELTSGPGVATTPDFDTAVDARFGEALALAGYSLTPGAPTQLRLVFRQMGAAPLEQDYTVFVHIRDLAGQMVAQADATPGGGAAPTSLWSPGEFVIDTYTFNLAPGIYSAALGFYTAETGERLGVSQAGILLGDELSLPAFSVP